MSGIKAINSMIPEINRDTMSELAELTKSAANSLAFDVPKIDNEVNYCPAAQQWTVRTP